MTTYPHHLCRGNAQFTVTEDGFFTVTNGTNLPRPIQLNPDEAFDLAIWLLKELKGLAQLPSADGG